jgi:Right handed beta helix region
MRNLTIYLLFLFGFGSSGAGGRASSSSTPPKKDVPPAAATAEIYVDGSSGSDASPGTQDRPLKTISKAAQVAVANHWNEIPTTITINPGIYREFVQVSGTDPNVGPPVTFQASKPGAVVISGSDVWTGWQQETVNPNRYIHEWPFRWGNCTAPVGGPSLQDIVLRREMIFVNGRLLNQVLLQTQMEEGSFYIDEADARAYIWPPAGTDMATSTVEVATRSQLFQSYRVPHLTLSGLVFEHASSCISTPQKSAVTLVDATDEVIEDSAIEWNNWIGLTLFNVTNSLALRTGVNHNGELGIDGYKLKNLTVEDVEASYNDWRGAWGHFVTFETGGAKFLLLHSGVFKNYRAIGNQGRGIWFDTDNIDISIDHAFLAQNLVGGIDLEANMGPFTIEYSRICNNQAEGIQNNDSESVRLIGNVVYNNQKGQIMVFGGSEPRTGTNWETHLPFSATAGKWSLSENTIMGADPKQAVYETLLFANQSPGSFLTTLSSDYNTWFNPQNQSVFHMGPGQDVDFLRWQSLSGQDKHSKFISPPIDPATACAAP